MPARSNSSPKEPYHNRKRRIIEVGSDEEDEVLDTMLTPARSSPSKEINDSISNPGTPDMSQRNTQQATQEQELADQNLSASSDGEEDSGALDPDGDISGTQNGFIQPEGDAGDLPQDLIDRTLSLEYKDLAPFFDQLADEIEKKKLPQARQQVEELEQALADTHSEFVDRYALVEQWCVYTWLYFIIGLSMFTNSNSPLITVKSYTMN
jgi:hypothetical protein